VVWAGVEVEASAAADEDGEDISATVAWVVDAADVTAGAKVEELIVLMSAAAI